MNSNVKLIHIIILTTAVRLAALNSQFFFMSAVRYNDFTNLIYIPAGISALSLLIFSYPAAIGTFLGSLIFTAFHRHFPPLDTIIYSCASTVSVTTAYACTQLYLKRTSHSLNWSRYTLPVIAGYFILDAALNSVIRAIGINSIIVDSPPTLTLISIKFMGDLVGAFLLFIALNLLTALYLKAVTARSHRAPSIK
jgi:hypothetical protein